MTDIFECNDITQFECFERNLFGAKAAWPLSVKAGDLCFLFNYYGQEKLNYGVFQAVGNGARNIVAGAWGSQYPCQVRVQLCSKERIAVPRSNIGSIVTDPDSLRVRNKLFGEPAQKLLEYFAGSFSRGFETGQRMDAMEEDFRLRYPRKFHCSDGHDVRSLSEQSIDEWLSTHQVYHEYERLANVPEHLVPDFTVYTADRHPVFIEFWGMMDDPTYQQRRLRKCEVYARHRCTLIELYQDDLRNRDFSLRTKLRAHNVLIT